MNKNDYIIRLERKEEHRIVEHLVREAFWNVYRPGCLEHYVLANQLSVFFHHKIQFRNKGGVISQLVENIVLQTAGTIHVPKGFPHKVFHDPVLFFSF